MFVIEIITLRGSTSLPDDFGETIIQIFMEQIGTSEQPGIHTYLQNNIGTDLSIHLHWSAEADSAQKSDIGFLIANYLRDIGLVSHTVWLEITPALFEQPSIHRMTEH